MVKICLQLEILNLQIHFLEQTPFVVLWSGEETRARMVMRFLEMGHPRPYSL